MTWRLIASARSAGCEGDSADGKQYDRRLLNEPHRPTVQLTDRGHGTHIQEYRP